MGRGGSRGGRGRGGGGGRGGGSRGGRSGGRGGKGRGGGSASNHDADGSQRQYDDSWKNNPENYFNAAFESYYLEQRILDSPDEWKALMHAFRQPLPTTFRITSGVPSAILIEEAMNKQWVPFLSSVQLSRLGDAATSLGLTTSDTASASIDEAPSAPATSAPADAVDADADVLAEDASAELANISVPPPTQIPFYHPKGFGWQLDVKKNVIRKHPSFKAFQQWLVHETDAGCISRQEAVSMVPPLFLDVRSDHLVLDLCAAPGSKTAQLVEMLHTRGPSSSQPLPRGEYDATPEGLVLANDSDTRRAHMLVHQASRIPSANLMVSNLDASMLPRIDVPWVPPTDNLLETKPIQRELKFDRILADVPCSGDGTLRKNIPIWKDWHSQNGLGLHPLQLRILLRGLSLLREGGRLVYSTCSLNPLENEAVVAAALIECGALRKSGGDIHIVDVQSEIPELTRRPGKRTWKVAPGRGKHLFSHATASASDTAPAEGSEPATAESSEAASSGSGRPVDYVEYEHFIKTIFSGQSPQDVKPDTVREDGVRLTCQRGELKGEAMNSTWLPNFPYVDSWDELQQRDAALANRTPKTLWPPRSDEAADKLQLERCMRFYPHLQNTGGFFVTVLEKRAPADGYLHGEQGLAAGMRRAMERQDLLHDTPSKGQGEAALLPAASESGAATRTAAKRELSPDGQPAESKRPKIEAASDAAETPTANSGEVALADPNGHIKADNHASDRAAKAVKQAVGAADFGHGQPNGMPYREDPMTFLSLDDPEVQSCIDFFKLNIDDASAQANHTLRFQPRNLVSRNADGKMVRSVSLVSSSARAIISGGGVPGMVPKKDENGRVEFDGDGEPVLAPSPHPTLNPVRLRLLSAGIKLFQRQDSTKAYEAGINTPVCKWRVTSDGLLVLLPYLNADKIIKISMSELAFLMSANYPSLYDIEEHAPALAPKVRRMALGSHIVQVGGPDAVEEPELGKPLAILPSAAASSSAQAANPPATGSEGTSAAVPGDGEIPAGSVPGEVPAEERTRAERKGEALYRARQQWQGRKLPVTIALPVWKAAASVNLMIDKQVKSALSYRLFGSDLSSATGERQFNAAPPPKKKNNRGNKPTRAEAKGDQDLADDEDAAFAAAA
ncbi:hypothetical protein V8E36_003830 [Tilletia maclaganii]